MNLHDIEIGTLLILLFIVVMAGYMVGKELLRNIKRLKEIKRDKRD